MYWIPVVLVGIVLFGYQWFFSHKWLMVVIPTLISALLMGLVIAIDFNNQTSDVEVWSGFVEDWKHVEEWDEWHPPVTSCSTDSNGKQTCTTTPGYWEHHYAENHLKTSDKGWFSIQYSPDGKKMDDKWPNKTAELEEMFPPGTPTASRHKYVNKVQASYSIYRNKEIDLADFPNLPDYPNTVRDQLYIDRIVGSVPKQAKANLLLSKINSELNVMVPDPENPGKKKSYKQVNLIFVNVGADKPEEVGFALQDHWEGGNKNDFIVAFSMDKGGNVVWAYPFSWSESELLKIEVKQLMEKQEAIKDFSPVVQEVADLVEAKFERKEFADFNYLQIDVSVGAHIMIWVLSVLTIAGAIWFDVYYQSTTVRSHSHQRPTFRRGRR